MDDAAFLVQLRLLTADRKRGAIQLARQALAILEQSGLENQATSGAELRRQLTNRARSLLASRPSMAVVEQLMERWLAEMASIPPTLDPMELGRQAAQAARELITASQAAALETARQVASHIAPQRTILTHSFSSTLLEVFRQLPERGVSVIVTESRPLNEGREMARLLAELAFPVTLITDAQAGLFTAQCDLVLLGADAVLADGTLINKIGSYPIALAAYAAGRPVVVCCDSFKHSTRLQIELEEMDPAEVEPAPQPGVTRRNIYFDRTPPTLVTAWISERGIAWKPPINGPWQWEDGQFLF